MNNEDLAYLQDSLKYLGFSEKLLLNDQLEHLIAKEPKEFHLSVESEFEDCKMEALLYFLRSEQHEMYIFNRYEALLRCNDDPAKDRGQTFYISKGTGVTFKEAFNLLQGRAVYKNLINMDGEKYNAWIQLNFGEKDLHNNYKMKQFSSQYGYDLEKTLEKYPIRELNDTQLRNSLIRSLKKGNLHVVTFEKSTKTEKMLIEACPQYKTINIHPIRSSKKNENNEQSPLDFYGE